MPNPQKVLIIQTAFIGDAILVSSLLESLKSHNTSLQICLMVRKGNESLFQNHPHLNNLLVWEKKRKWKSFFELLKLVRAESFDVVFCIQRHFTMAAFSLCSNSKTIVGFKENPLSILFHKKVAHAMGDGRHEVERNIALAQTVFSGIELKKPKLYFSSSDEEFVKQYQSESYVCMAPSSVWQTKQLPVHKWIELIENTKQKVFLLGGPGDKAFIEGIAKQIKSNTSVHVLAGKLSLMQSAILMKGAAMNFVNDSGPLHLCSAVDAPVSSFFCSTIPAFGFGPLSSVQFVFESKEDLKCRPCGMHGKKSCPEKHFACGNSINIDEVVEQSLS